MSFLSLKLSLNAEAISHRAWYLEEIGRPADPAPTYASTASVSSRVLNLSDSVSGQLEASTHLKYVQLGLGAGYNAFALLNSAQELTTKTDLSGERAFFSLDLSKLYVNERNYFGRMSAKLVKFNPSVASALRILIETGVLSSVQQPWEVRFQLSGFFYLNKGSNSDFVFITLSSGKSYFFNTENHQLRISGSFTLGQILKQPQNSGENLLFSFGPEFQYSNPSIGKISLSIPFRVWMDWIKASSGNSYSTDFNTPAFRIAWTQYW